MLQPGKKPSKPKMVDKDIFIAKALFRTNKGPWEQVEIMYWGSMLRPPLLIQFPKKPFKKLRKLPDL